MSEIQSFVESIFDELVAIRRDIHAHPEVGMTEVRTSALIRSELEKMGVDEIQQPLPHRRRRPDPRHQRPRQVRRPPRRYRRAARP